MTKKAIKETITKEAMKDYFLKNKSGSLSKAEVNCLISTISQMEENEAAEFIVQIMNKYELAKSVIDNMAEMSQCAYKSNDESMKATAESINITLESFREIINKDNISAEERRWFTEKMIDLTKMIYEKDAENKQFIIMLQKLLVYFGIAAISITSIGLLIANIDTLKGLIGAKI